MFISFYAPFSYECDKTVTFVHKIVFSYAVIHLEMSFLEIYVVLSWKFISIAAAAIFTVSNHILILF